MDKYTVDLDKVLNDFEYNELTNEQDHLATASASACQVIPTAYSPGIRPRNTETAKHSINTVFKSLDDYVSLDIPTTQYVVPECKASEDNKSTVVPAESNILVDLSSQNEEAVMKNPTFKFLGGDNSIIEGLNLKVSSQENIVFNKTILDGVDADNSDSESTESVYLDMSGGSRNPSLNNNIAEKIPEINTTVETLNKGENIELKLVGFDNTLDIDDAELSQYLEDLEKELNAHTKDDAIELQRKFVENEVKIDSEVQLDIEASEIIKDRRDSSQDRPNSLDIVNNLIPTRECINLIGQPGSTPYNNAYVSNEYNFPKANVGPEENVILEVIQTVQDPTEQQEQLAQQTNSSITISETSSHINTQLADFTTTSNINVPHIHIEPAIIQQATCTQTGVSNTEGDNISCGSTASISSSADTASSSAMSPTFSEASTNSVQSADDAAKNKQPYNSKRKTNTDNKRDEQLVDSATTVPSTVAFVGIMGSDVNDVVNADEDGERLLSLDLDDSIDEEEQLEQEEMLLDDSSRSEDIIDDGKRKRKDGDLAEEEISAMDFIAETSTLSQETCQGSSLNQPSSKLKSRKNNLNNNHQSEFKSPSSTDEHQFQMQRDKEEKAQSSSGLSNQQQSKSSELSVEAQIFEEPNSEQEIRTQGQSTNQTNNNSETNVVRSDLNNQQEHSADPSAIPQPTSGPTMSEPTVSASIMLDEATAAANSWLGKEQPIWIPDTEALNCLHCDMKFTVIKRRHHCRACGLVLCSRCCNSKFRLDYLNSREARVCAKCHEILLILYPQTASTTSDLLQSSSGNSNQQQLSNNTSPSGSVQRQPNPNNPMDYCSTVPPPLQLLRGAATNAGSGTAGASASGAVPSVMVPVGVLKRNGSTSGSKKSSKSVMFCDGIRPGSDLTNLDQDFNYNMTTTSSSGRRSPDAGSNTSSEGTIGSASVDGGSPQNTHLMSAGGHKVVGRQSGVNQPDIDKGSKSFIPASVNGLPPRVTVYKSDISYSECSNSPSMMETLKIETVTFALQKNLYVNVKIVNMDCCINKTAWCFSTEGLMSVGQDEILILLEIIENETTVPKDVFHHLNDIYLDAVKGQTVAELGVSLHNNSNFLESKSHVGFLYIRPTFQCLHNLTIPKESYLIGILIHRWETPWAKVFPLRLVLRLGAEYRYYPSPIISTRHRDSVFVEIGHTIINILADFRNFSYSLPHIRGLSILMEDKKTTINIPVNRYDQVMKTLNNSSEHILAFGGNFSSQADSHLVCIQNKNETSENTYTTHAINIHNKPRKITGASYIVFNGALKSTSGLSAKSSIVEDGLMIQIHPEDMIKLRENLRQMRAHVIRCGPVAAPPVSCESDVGAVQSNEMTVAVEWGEPDVCFNVGVKSLIDDTSMSGIPSIRVHQGKDFVCNSGNRFIRWTEVFILQNGEENNKNSEPVDVSKVASDIARATCTALVKYLDLLASNNFYKVGIRTNLHIENVSYSAGSNGIKLPPIYMKSLDNELIPVLHRITASNSYASAVVLELVFRILNAGGDSAVPLHLTR